MFKAEVRSQWANDITFGERFLLKEVFKTSEDANSAIRSTLADEASWIADEWPFNNGVHEVTIDLPTGDGLGMDRLIGSVEEC